MAGSSVGLHAKIKIRKANSGDKPHLQHPIIIDEAKTNLISARLAPEAGPLRLALWGEHAALLDRTLVHQRIEHLQTGTKGTKPNPPMSTSRQQSNRKHSELSNLSDCDLLR